MLQSVTAESRAASHPPHLGHLPDAINGLQLESLEQKLQDDNPDWTPQRAAEAIHDYRYFLALCLMYRDEPIVPSRDVDEAWHAHILFTEKYMKDCEAVFGSYLHHWPYFGLQRDEVIDICAMHLRNTVNLYRQHFNMQPKTYAKIEEEILDAKTTKRLTSQKGLSSTVNLADPRNAKWRTCVTGT